MQSCKYPVRLNHTIIEPDSISQSYGISIEWCLSGVYFITDIWLKCVKPIKWVKIEVDWYGKAVFTYLPQCCTSANVTSEAETESSDATMGMRRLYLQKENNTDNKKIVTVTS